MRYLYIGYYVEEGAFDLICREKINNMSAARQKFESNLIHGLYEHLGDQIDFISYVPTNDAIQLPQKSDIHGATVKHFFINKAHAKSVLKTEREFKKYLCDQYTAAELNDMCVIMYAVNPAFLVPLLKLRKKYGIKLLTICSEVPALRRYGNSLAANIKRRILTYFNGRFDGYVLFSEAMADVLKIENKPYTVLEGIAPDKMSGPKTGKKNIVMYAGGLAGDNNVLKLVTCCSKIADIHEVWICGVGEDAEAIQKIAERDKRIQYFGRLSNDRVVEMEKKAKILVSIRSPKVELTKYSFPSKILEYIASGTLVLSTELGGIPAEYYSHMLVTSEEENDIIEAIQKGLSLSEEEYVRRCSEAQAYIQTYKNYSVQAKRIVELTAAL